MTDSRSNLRGRARPLRLVLVYQHFMVEGLGSTKPYDLARHLVAAGHRVTVICGRGYLSKGLAVRRGLVQRLRIHGIDVLCVGVDYRQGMGFVRRALSFLAFTLLAMVVTCRLPRYDVLLASSTPLTVGLVGLVSRYVRRVPYVFEVRDLWPEVPHLLGFLRSGNMPDLPERVAVPAPRFAVPDFPAPASK